MPKRKEKAEQMAHQGNGSNFFSSGLRQKVDHLMDILYSGGVNNPMDSIEQLSYLLFLRLLSERDDQTARIERKYRRIFSGSWARYAWGNFITLTGDELFAALREAVEKIHELPGLSTTGKELFRNATLKIYDRPTLRAVVQGVAAMDLASRDGYDLKGDMYEYLLSKLAQSGTNGQFRTPRHIIDLIVRLVDPKPDERICDPACGTAGFLIGAYRYILQSHTKPADVERGIIDGSQLKPKQWEFLEHEAFSGYDNDANMVKISILNLYLHQLERVRIEHFNPLTTSHGGRYPGQEYDVVLANPPFAGEIQKDSILADLDLESRSTELLFVKWFLDHLAPLGRAGIIVPEGVLFGASKAHRRIRQLLVDKFMLEAVISLPSGAFKPYSGTATAILVVKNARPGKDEQVWFYDCEADGWSLDDKRAPLLSDDKLGVAPLTQLGDADIARNNLPDILRRWPDRKDSERERDRTAQSFCVPRSDIVGRECNLSLRTYREVSPSAAAERPPAEILDNLLRLEDDIREGLQDLRKML